MSTMGVVPIRPSPQKLTTAACVVLTTTPVQVTTAALKQQQRRPVEPAGARTGPGNNRRRVAAFSSYVPASQPPNVLRRNARERNRVKQVNHGFTALRNHIPSAAKNKKMSKVETLRRAVEYIQNLQALLEENDAVSAAATASGAREEQESPQQTLTPSSVCSVSSGDSGYTETQPFYLSPTPRSSAPPPPHHVLVSPTHHPEPSSAAALHPLVSPACPSDTSSLTPLHHSLVSPACPSDTSSLTPLHHPLVSPVCGSEASAAGSPTPSYGSDTPAPGSAQPVVYDQYGGAHFSGYEDTSFQESCENISPEDEELLDAIAWWQASQ